MQVIDLTHTIKNGMPVFPGSKEVKLIHHAGIAAAGFNELLLNISGHNGTHIDCGRHLSDESADLSGIPAHHFTGRGLVIDCRYFGENPISKSKLEIFEKSINEVDFVLFLTGWSNYWNSERYFSSFPVLSSEAAEYLSTFQLKGAGVDNPGFDPVDSTDLTNHKILLSKGRLLIENLTNLEQLPEKGFTFCCFPLKIHGGDGSPVRAVAVI